MRLFLLAALCLPKCTKCTTAQLLLHIWNLWHLIRSTTAPLIPPKNGAPVQCFCKHVSRKPLCALRPLLFSKENVSYPCALFLFNILNLFSAKDGDMFCDCTLCISLINLPCICLPSPTEHIQGIQGVHRETQFQDNMASLLSVWDGGLTCTRKPSPLLPTKLFPRPRRHSRQGLR